MQQKTVTFRAPGDKIKALDSLAALQQRDRSFVLNEAVDQYLSLNECHIALINEGIRQADAGKLKTGDAIDAVNGNPVANIEQFTGYLKNTKPGEVVTLDYRQRLKRCLTRAGRLRWPSGSRKTTPTG